MIFQHQLFSRTLLLVTALLPGICMTKNKRSENIGMKTLDGFGGGKFVDPASLSSNFWTEDLAVICNVI